MFPRVIFQLNENPQHLMKSAGEEEEESMRVEDKGGEEQSGGRALLLAFEKNGELSVFSVLN